MGQTLTWPVQAGLSIEIMVYEGSDLDPEHYYTVESFEPGGGIVSLVEHVKGIGGKHKGGGSGTTHKLPVVIAVESRRRTLRDPETGKVLERELAGRLRLQQLPSKSASVIEAFASQCLAPGAVILTDDGGEFETLVTRGYRHQPLAMLKSRARMDSWLPMGPHGPPPSAAE